ncbi:MAG: hypothetical protein EAZ90_20630 [Oscillatoriales cyanobacterium]|nr:MAG: hypothetical protein EAZ94_19900 [Oscillatoriales cyanobacterium]TAE20671.1 MAG: hypothetical protein EAZ93_23095 [Oscillatoriales cyanobacterium]TAE40378.1 MAG: hypothetical protein EAZ90_20630 [Oscillatoriales cyanobacterium]TAG95670.1 MAG: hypothetical protein EAZ19_11045 [Oscillatoriales cyanobacterium]TAH17146.1 MAG: hypothetical protein EAZ10_18980 [Oscillatoriales cyanobacterium]
MSFEISKGEKIAWFSIAPVKDLSTHKSDKRNQKSQRLIALLRAKRHNYIIDAKVLQFKLNTENIQGTRKSTVSTRSSPFKTPLFAIANHLLTASQTHD